MPKYDSETEKQRKSSTFNGDLNGLLDAVEGHASLPESSAVVNPLDRHVICLSGDDNSSIRITGKDVEIVASNESNICSKARGSNKVKIQPVAKYDWEQKYYYGNLIAVSNAYLAYATRGANGLAMVRVLSITTAERILLKGMKGGVTDLAFAHLNSNQLACLDEAGSLFVWRLTMESGKLQDEIIVHIQRQDDTPLNNLRRIIWCPYIPEENEDGPEDSSQTIALLLEDRAEVWDLDIVRASHSSWPSHIMDVKEGFIVVKGHSGHLSEGALSPDGTVLATASYDGYVKFWQIYIEGLDQPRCLHEWKPHGGRPLSCLLFCDNHKKQDPEVPFWRFLITGADQNRELKMWCTVSWTCLQTIRFSPDPFASSLLPELKVSLDLSSEFLILTDVQRKVLYVMELMQNQDDGKASFTFISEFLLTHPVLSFGIQDVSRCRLSQTEVLPSEEDSEGINAEESMEPETEESANGVLIKMFCVHTKALQDVQIWFKPHHNRELGAFITEESHDNFDLPAHMADINQDRPQASKNMQQDSQADFRRITADFLLLPPDNKPILMTPDAFMSSSASFQQISSSPGGSSITTLTSVTPVSMVSMNDVVMSRSSEELSPKLQLENSLSLSSPTCGGNIQANSRNSSVLLTGLSEKLSPKAIVQVSQPSLPLELQGLEPLGLPQASPTRERSPDVISSASTSISQGIPEIASETLQRSYPTPLASSLSVDGVEASNHTDSMSSAASALHMLSPRTCPTSEHILRPLEIRSFGVESERVSATIQPENNTAQNNEDSLVSQPWPAAPDITRETRNSLVESVRDEQERVTSFHRHSYHLLQQHDSQDASAEQSDHDDEVAGLASTSVCVGGKGPSQRLPIKDWKTKMSPRSSPKLRRKTKKDDSDLSQSPRVSESQANSEQQGDLIALLLAQQRELAELRQNQLELIQRLTDHLDAAQSSIMGHVERVIDNQQEQEQRRLDQILSDGQQRNGQLQEYLSQQLAQTLPGALCNRLDKTLREEIKKSVPPCISKCLDTVTGQLSSSIASKLAAVEGILKENVTKMVKSKNITDAIGRSAAEGLQVQMQSTYRDAFQGIVLPAFEKGCQSMFQQINSSFKQGTQEYIGQMETQLKNIKTLEHEIHDPLVRQLQELIDSLQTTAEQLTGNLSSSVRSEVQHQLHIAVGTMQDSILTQVQRIIKEEVSHAMKEQQAAVTTSIMQAMRSAAGTPIPSTHLDFQSQQTHILQLMQQGHINQAFQQALTASDLNLILYVCDTVDPQQVFGQQPCPLTQPVLLSLIQQLSFDFGTRTDLKLNYLEEAVMHLDHSDPVTRDHMGTVMNQVRQKLFQFLQAEPHNPLNRPARRLMIMLQGLVTPSLN
uniref:Enhancer of mRNA-decapping protein 4 n=1 Tax=Leptobrachium leishanense TaxID=445787 RepID=A0A8C5N2P6_9ANUR